MKLTLLALTSICMFGFGTIALAEDNDGPDRDPYCIATPGCAKVRQFHTQVNDREATLVVGSFDSQTTTDMPIQYSVTIYATNVTTRYLLYDTKKEAFDYARNYLVTYAAAVTRNAN